VAAEIDHTPGFERVVISRSLDFYNTEEYLWHGDKPGFAPGRGKARRVSLRGTSAQRSRAP